MATYNIGDRPLCCGAQVTVALTAFVWFARKDEFAACHTVSLALTDNLLFSTSPHMVGEAGLTPKVSITVRTVDSNPCRYTWRARQAAATCLDTCVCHVATSRLAARFTHIPFGYGGCQVPYHVIMPDNLIVQQVQSFGCFDTPFVHNFVTI